jgi:putative ubiquitin-RnfH superfamily antitoxin RatB of RatAB toxin-antitoxin module
MAADLISIEVAAALPERQILVPLRVPAGTTLAEAVALAGLAERLPGIEIEESRLGIFGKKRPPETTLSEGDRVEVYRPLTADPKEIRRQLAELARARKKGGS